MTGVRVVQSLLCEKPPPTVFSLNCGPFSVHSLHLQDATRLQTQLPSTSNIEYISGSVPVIIPGLSRNNSWPIAVSLVCLYNSIFPLQNPTSISSQQKEKLIYFGDVFLHRYTAIPPATSASLPKYTACGGHFIKSLA